MAGTLVPFGDVTLQELLSATTIDSYEVMRRPTVDPIILANKYPAEKIDLMKDFMMGSWEPIKNQVYNWTEENPSFNFARTRTGATATVRGVQSGSKFVDVYGKSVQVDGLSWIRLDDASCLPPVTVNGIVAGTKTNIRPNAVLTFPTKGINCQYLVIAVEVVAGFEIKVYLRKFTSTAPDLDVLLPASGGNVAGVDFSYLQNVDSEAGFGILEGIMNTYQNKQAKLTPLTEHFQITDMAQAAEFWFTGIKTPSGTRQLYMESKVMEDTIFRFLKQAMTRLAIGDATASGLTNYLGKSIVGSRGFVPEMLANGSTIYTGETLTVQSYRDIDRKRRDMKMSSNLTFMEGAEFGYRNTDFIASTFNNGSIVRDEKNPNLEWDSFKYGELLVKRCSASWLNDPDNLGMANSPFKDMAFVIPSDKVYIQTGSEGNKTPKEVDRLTFLYNRVASNPDTGISNEESARLPRFFRTTFLDGLAPAPTSTQQVLTFHVNATIGCALHASDQTMILRKE